MKELLKYFLLLGATGFGGPLSLVQLMREEFVEKQNKISHQDFDQAFTMIKAMPGPVAFQMAVFLGYKFHKLKGAVLAGFGLLWPSFLMMIFLGYFYNQFSKNIYISIVLEGFLFSVSAVILLSLKNMVLTYFKHTAFWFLIVVSCYVAWLHIIPEPFLILGCGAMVVLVHYLQKNPSVNFFAAGIMLADHEKLFSLFKTCFFGGAFVFGTGLAILPVLQSDFVDHYHWLTLQEFNNGVTFGQMTPGPVTITATFLGYKIAGLWGACVATFAIFITPFIHMVTWFPLALKWLSRQLWIKPFLLGATAAVVGSILMTLFKMNEKSFVTPMFWILFLGTAGVLIKKPRVPLIYLIFSGGVINLIVSLMT